MPIVRHAVCPVPNPNMTRPGASSLIVAMEWAMTGGMRVPTMVTPVPSRIRSVCSAASARQAYTSEAMSCESTNQAFENPSCSASTACFHPLPMCDWKPTPKSIGEVVGGKWRVIGSREFVTGLRVAYPRPGCQAEIIGWMFRRV